MRAMYKALIGTDPTPEHLIRFRLEVRRGEWQKTKDMVIRTNKSITWHYISRKATAESISPVKLYLFGMYLDFPAKTCPPVLFYPRKYG